MCSGKMECTATLTSTKAMGKREMPSDPLYQEVMERAFMGEGPSARPPDSWERFRSIVRGATFGGKERWRSYVKGISQWHSLGSRGAI